MYKSKLLYHHNFVNFAENLDNLRYGVGSENNRNQINK